jgi:hypothetical protein
MLQLVEACSSIIFWFEHDLRANAFRVSREGKPVSTLPDHALAQDGLSEPDAS